MLFGNMTFAQPGEIQFFCNYGENGSGVELCRLIQNSNFESDLEAEQTLDRVLYPIGIPRNFVLISCPNIRNAAAVTYAKDNLRYLVYDNAFMEMIANSTSKWSNLSILAHEVGHFLCDHTTRPTIDLSVKRARELEADEFSGFIMYKLGASLIQSQAALVSLIKKDKDDTFSDHPRLNKRLEAIKKGYDKAAAQIMLTSLISSESAETYYNKGNSYFDQGKYYEAASQYSLAIDLNGKYVNAYFNRGLSRKYSGDTSGAIADFSEAIKLDKNYEFAYLSLGNINADFNDNQNAMLFYDKAIKLNPNYTLAYVNRAFLKLKLGDKNGASLDFKKSCELNDQEACTELKKLDK